jgi:hypothetical protein
MYQFCISGAAQGKSVEEGQRLATEVGAALAAANHVLLTGATVGLPNYAAEAYKAANGRMSVGISPAASKIEHMFKYRLPTKAYDMILYTGLHYIGRDMLLINSCDAVVSIGGRLGTLHEFTVAMETDKPIGFLQGAGGISTEIMDILHAAGVAKSKNVVFSENAQELLAKLEDLLHHDRQRYFSERNGRYQARLEKES